MSPWLKMAVHNVDHVEFGLTCAVQKHLTLSIICILLCAGKSVQNDLNGSEFALSTFVFLVQESQQSKPTHIALGYSPPCTAGAPAVPCRGGQRGGLPVTSSPARLPRSTPRP